MPARKSAQLSAIIALGFAKLLTCLDFKVQIVFLMAGLGLPAKVSQGSLVCRRFTLSHLRYHIKCVHSSLHGWTESPASATQAVIIECACGRFCWKLSEFLLECPGLRETHC